MDKTMIPLCGLWGNEKNGQRYLSGNLNGTSRILIFQNKYKTEDKHPDYQVYLVPNEKKDKKEQDVSL